MKPDQLIKRRGKLGLVKVKAGLQEVQDWVKEHLNSEIQVCLFTLLFNVHVYTLNNTGKYILFVREFKQNRMVIC